MTTEQLAAFIKAYNQSVKKCIKSEDKDGKLIDEQSDWVWFDRKKLEELLALTDENEGGIKIYFGQYTKSNLDILPPQWPDREDYIGRLSLALVASNKNSNGYEDIYLKDSERSNHGIQNTGDLCPPTCPRP